PEFRDRCLAPPRPEEYAKLMEKRDDMPQEDWLRKLEQVMFNRAAEDIDDIDFNSDWGAEAALSVAGGSLAVGVIDKVMSVRELIDAIIRDAEHILGREGNLGRLLG
ncbi:MAG: hypothetical protein JSV02_09105, partial [Dehalococcoidia bacterium]